jgi:hypothetical protein
MFWVVILGAVVAILALILLGVGYLQGWPVYPHGFKQKGVVGGGRVGVRVRSDDAGSTSAGAGSSSFCGAGDFRRSWNWRRNRSRGERIRKTRAKPDGGQPKAAREQSPGDKHLQVGLSKLVGRVGLLMLRMTRSFGVVAAPGGPLSQVGAPPPANPDAF